MEFLNRFLIIPKVLLATDQDDGEALTKVKDLGYPLHCHLTSVSRQSAQIRNKTLLEAPTVPSPGRYQGSLASRQQNRSESHVNLGTTEGAADRNLPDQPYPRELARRACRRLRHRQRSSRTRLGRRPSEWIRVSESRHETAIGSKASRCCNRASSDEQIDTGRAGDTRTSGNVPFEKTLHRLSARQIPGQAGDKELVVSSGAMDNAHINRHVFPQAPSPTMTSLRRISAMLLCRVVGPTQADME